MEIAKINEKAALRGCQFATDDAEACKAQQDRAERKINHAIKQYHFAKRQYRFIMLGHYLSTPTKDATDATTPKDAPKRICDTTNSEREHN